MAKAAEKLLQAPCFDTAMDLREELEKSVFEAELAKRRLKRVKRKFEAYKEEHGERVIGEIVCSYGKRTDRKSDMFWRSCLRKTQESNSSFLPRPMHLPIMEDQEFLTKSDEGKFHTLWSSRSIPYPTQSQ